MPNTYLKYISSKIWLEYLFLKLVEIDFGKVRGYVVKKFLKELVANQLPFQTDGCYPFATEIAGKSIKQMSN